MSNVINFDQVVTEATDYVVSKQALVFEVPTEKITQVNCHFVRPGVEQALRNQGVRPVIEDNYSNYVRGVHALLAERGVEIV